jgi:thioredoxin-dependent peroxiredoxin
MIEARKATKGRRMSKKTRNKSRKTSPAKATGAARKRSGKMAVAKARKAKPAKSAARRPQNSAAKTSAKAASKPVKATAPARAKSGLAEGTKAPAFRLPRDGGDTVALSDYAGQKLVLFFYPRADTPGCTKEAIDFTRLASAFAASRTAVLGVSADSPKAQQSFRDKHQLSVPLVSDEQHAMLEAYGVWGEKSMYGRTFQGIVRTTVLIGADGLVAKIWRNVKVDGHADEVLATVRSL